METADQTAQSIVPEEHTERQTDALRREAESLVMIAVAALGLAILVRIVFIQPYNIPSGSMAPTLLTGDFITVGKAEYGYSRASLIWPLTRLPVYGRVLGKPPMRGDVIVFKNKKDGNRDYIKRIIGLPGEELQVLESRVLINGVPVPRDFLGVRNAICDGEDTEVPIWRETLPNGIAYDVQECAGDEGRLDTKGPYFVPPGHYFVMGDNRDQSQDSRVTAYVGTVPFEDIVGKAQHIMVSVDGANHAPWQVWALPGAVRGARFLKPIE
ncbi:MAG: signal peptidase I [Pseudomonadota bacterium]